jgi:hypothetical protein
VKNLSKAQLIRIEAVNAASIAFSGKDRFTDIDELWSLCVFFERYIAFGGEATLKDFGPKKPKKAPVLRLVK